MRLRHHHLLCVQFFRGEGYDRRFVENMTSLVSALRSSEELTVHLSTSCDDVCSCCPHLVAGECEYGDSVLRKDRRVARFLGFPEEGAFPAGPLWKAVGERLRTIDSLEGICGECEWLDLCEEVLTGGKWAAGSDKQRGVVDHHDQLLYRHNS
jgi:hypothetical protein